MALKEFFASRVVSKDKRVVVNRVLKDILFYGLMILCFGLLLLAVNKTMDGTRYAVYLTVGVVVVRAILKMLEEHRPEEFHWFWSKMEWVIKIANSILNLIGKKPLPLPDKGN